MSVQYSEALIKKPRESSVSLRSFRALVDLYVRPEQVYLCCVNIVLPILS